MIQIDRDPGCWLLMARRRCARMRRSRGGLLAAGNQSMTVNQGGIPFDGAEVGAEARFGSGAEASGAVDGGDAAPERCPAGARALPRFHSAVVQPERPRTPRYAGVQRSGARDGVRDPVGAAEHGSTGRPDVPEPVGALGEMWWRFELRPTSKRISDAFSAQMLPRGQYVWFDAADTFAALTGAPAEEDPQAAVDQPAAPAIAAASPAHKPTLTSIGGSG